MGNRLSRSGSGSGAAASGVSGVSVGPITGYIAAQGPHSALAPHQRNDENLFLPTDGRKVIAVLGPTGVGKRRLISALLRDAAGARARGSVSSSSFPIVEVTIESERSPSLTLGWQSFEVFFTLTETEGNGRKKSTPFVIYSVTSPTIGSGCRPRDMWPLIKAISENADLIVFACGWRCGLPGPNYDGGCFAECLGVFKEAETERRFWRQLDSHQVSSASSADAVNAVENFAWDYPGRWFKRHEYREKAKKSLERLVEHSEGENIKSFISVSDSLKRLNRDLPPNPDDPKPTHAEICAVGFGEDPKNFFPFTPFFLDIAKRAETLRGKPVRIGPMPDLFRIWTGYVAAELAWLGSWTTSPRRIKFELWFLCDTAALSGDWSADWNSTSESGDNGNGSGERPRPLQIPALDKSLKELASEVCEKRGYSAVSGKNEGGTQQTDIERRALSAFREQLQGDSDVGDLKFIERTRAVWIRNEGVEEYLGPAGGPGGATDMSASTSGGEAEDHDGERAWGVSLLEIVRELANRAD